MHQTPLSIVHNEVLHRAAALWQELTALRAAARPRLSNAVSALVNEVRVACSAALLCTSQAGQATAADAAVAYDTVSRSQQLCDSGSWLGQSWRTRTDFSARNDTSPRHSAA